MGFCCGMRDLVLGPGIEPGPLHWGTVLATGRAYNPLTLSLMFLFLQVKQPSVLLCLDMEDFQDKEILVVKQF